MSTALTVLRSLPEQQAGIYNTYLPQSTQVRMDQYNTGDAKLAQIQRLVSTATSQLADLLQRANKAEQTIRDVISSDVAATEASAAQIRWAFDHGIGLHAICQQLVNDNDRVGFAALRAFLPWAARAGQLPGSKGQIERSIKDAQAALTEYEKPLLSPGELNALSEVQECDISMPLLRQNFTALQGFFQDQSLPLAVQGSFKRLERLWRWQGLPNDTLVKGSLNLFDDFNGAHAAKPNVPVHR